MKSEEKLMLGVITVGVVGALYLERKAAAAVTGAVSAAEHAAQSAGSAIGSSAYNVLNPGAGASATSSTPLPVGSPGWYRSIGYALKDIPASAYDQTTWLPAGG